MRLGDLLMRLITDTCRHTKGKVKQRKTEIPINFLISSITFLTKLEHHLTSASCAFMKYKR